MKPLDFRSATYADLADRLAGQRVAVLAAWHLYGPGTTAEIASAARLSILTFRPRTTELYQLGYIALTAEQPHKGEGVYCARTAAEHEAWFAAQHLAATPGQRLLALGA